MTNFGVACDIWALDLDYIVGVVERPDRYSRDNVWIKRDVIETNQDLLCRYGHTAGLIDDTSVFVYGGVNQ